jgi:hypothetical protein
MKENNISKYRSNPTVEDGVVAIGISAINMSSLSPKFPYSFFSLLFLVDF